MAEENKDGIKVTSLEELTKKCMDSGGYVVFVASLSNKVDDKGNRMLDFDYRRYQFPFEDVKTAIVKFKEAFIDDVGQGLD